MKVEDNGKFSLLGMELCKTLVTIGTKKSTKPQLVYTRTLLYCESHAQLKLPQQIDCSFSIRDVSASRRPSGDPITQDSFVLSAIHEIIARKI